MTEGERMNREDAYRFAMMVEMLADEVGFSISKAMAPPGAPPFINPYTCRVSMPMTGEGNPKPIIEAHGATMFEALTRALADAHERRAVVLRVCAGG